MESQRERDGEFCQPYAWFQASRLWNFRSCGHSLHPFGVMLLGVGFLSLAAESILTKTHGFSTTSWEGVGVGYALDSEAGVVKEFVRQLSLGCPGVCLGVVAVEGGQVLNAAVCGQPPPARHIELVPHHRGPVMHPPVFHVRTLDKFVGLRVISKHPPCVT